MEKEKFVLINTHIHFKAGKQEFILLQAIIWMNVHLIGSQTCKISCFKSLKYKKEQIITQFTGNGDTECIICLLHIWMLVLYVLQLLGRRFGYVIQCFAASITLSCFYACFMWHWPKCGVLKLWSRFERVVRSNIYLHFAVPLTYFALCHNKCSLYVVKH